MRELETKPEWCPMVWVSGNCWWKDYAAYKISINEFFPSILPNAHTHTPFLPLCVFVFIALWSLPKYEVRNCMVMKIHLCFTYIFLLLLLHIYFVKWKMPCIESSNFECKTGSKHCEVPNTNNMFINIFYTQVVSWLGSLSLAGIIIFLLWLLLFFASSARHVIGSFVDIVVVVFLLL